MLWKAALALDAGQPARPRGEKDMSLGGVTHGAHGEHRLPRFRESGMGKMGENKKPIFYEGEWRVRTPPQEATETNSFYPLQFEEQGVNIPHHSAQNG